MKRISSSYLGQFQGCLGDIAYELRIQYLSTQRQANWAPAINAYRCCDEIVICVELAGVDKHAIDLQIEPQRVLIRGERHLPQPEHLQNPPKQILALEIDQGVFEREITLPLEIDPQSVRAEQRNGLLWIYLPIARRGTIAEDP